VNSARRHLLLVLLLLVAILVTVLYVVFVLPDCLAHYPWYLCLK